MNTKKIQLLAQGIASYILGKKYFKVVLENTDNARVELHRRLEVDNGKAMVKRSEAVCISLGIYQNNSDKSGQALAKRYSKALSVNPILFGLLHEIGHSFYKGEFIAKKRVDSQEEYMKHPEEMFANNWASDYIRKNPREVKIWSEMFDKHSK